MFRIDFKPYVDKVGRDFNELFERYFKRRDKN